MHLNRMKDAGIKVDYTVVKVKSQEIISTACLVSVTPKEGWSQVKTGKLPEIVERILDSLPNGGGNGLLFATIGGGFQPLPEWILAAIAADPPIGFSWIATYHKPNRCFVCFYTIEVCPPQVGDDVHLILPN